MSPVRVFAFFSRVCVGSKEGCFGNCHPPFPFFFCVFFAGGGGCGSLPTHEIMARFCFLLRLIIFSSYALFFCFWCFCFFGIPGSREPEHQEGDSGHEWEGRATCAGIRYQVTGAYGRGAQAVPATRQGLRALARCLPWYHSVHPDTGFGCF